ncbi:MAG: SCP2 sterol-binding domain-containing protein [Actinomycetota bacterium]
MAVFLSEDWIAELARVGGGLSATEGVSMSIQHEIAGAPDGKVRFHLVWTDGVLTEAALGKIADPDISVQAKAPEALKILHGEMSPDVGYMQGRLKVDGDHRRLMIDLRDWRASEAYRALWSHMADFTD